ncbi:MULTISPECIES: DUF1048 domain-containing protein [Gordonia]|jgi:DNA-binding ferritin-like protein (Dps family)|uniref:DUF1048 domain-containing protein n=1 Tax=Gordonia TaxID=2053 RepID=UPI0030C78642
MSIINKIVGDKKRYRAYQARVAALPTPHRETVEALARYLMYFGPGDSDNLTSMLEDLTDLFEQSVADGVDVRGIVGDNPVDFAEDFQRNYPEGQWIGRERDRLNDTISKAVGDEGTPR